jgi:predicted AlkP superfamily phosphohydrolase/phosphomutase
MKAPPEPGKERPKIVVVGLDGASWDVIHPLVCEGKLPTFKTLLNQGSSAHMQSSLPYVTFPAWKCYSTGKNPGKLGVFWFARVDFNSKRIVPHNSFDFESRELWDYLTDFGYTCGVINMPTTFPPKKVKGFMISGPPIPEEKGFTYPADLEKILKKKYNYRVNSDPARFILQEHPDIEHIEELIDMRIAVTMDFIHDVDFLHTTVFYLDSAQHFYWHEKDVLSHIYQKIDSFLGKIIKEIGDKSYLFLVSDHGFGTQRAIFYLNEWLATKGYLVKKGNIRTFLPAVLPSRQQMIKGARATGVIQVLPKIVPKPLLNRLLNLFPREGKFTVGTAVEDYIDWEKTVALAVHSLIYMNKRIGGGEYSQVQDQLMKELKTLVDPHNNACIQDVLKCSQIYHGDYVDYGPDLAVQLRDDYEVNHAVFHTTPEIWRTVKKGNHRRTGIFLACGPGIKRSETALDIYDVAPTILHICGVPIPEDIDGRVVKEIFADDSELARREIVSQPMDEKEKIKKKIEAMRKMGYI